jgi:exodeoxyribonuclease (lambda-induced)
MQVIFHNDPQGSEEWMASRRGRITGSKFKDARERLKNGDPSAKAKLYARNVARERLGGKAEDVYQNAAMRFGSEQEPEARFAYETTTGRLVTEVGFAATVCGMYGLSPDGLVGDDGVIEVKTLVGSDNFFTCVIDEDYSAFIDQCLGYLLFLDRQWVDLVMWTPDLEQAGLGLVIHRIHRKDHEVEIAALKNDLEAFAQVVRKLEIQMRIKAAKNLAALKQVAELAEIE